MLGLLGGTFDPPHNGHLALARAALEELGLAKIIFIPANIPPHKTGKKISSMEHRMAMLKLAIGKESQFEISDIEFRREGPSYTIDTIKRLKEIYKGEELVFLLGLDNVGELDDWFHPEMIFDEVAVAAVNRPGFVPSGKFAGRVRYFDMTPVDISSSEIRERINSGQAITGLLPAEVENYVINNRLYKNNG